LLCDKWLEDCDGNFGRKYGVLGLIGTVTAVKFIINGNTEGLAYFRDLSVDVWIILT
jgi:hypothetical protein